MRILLFSASYAPRIGGLETVTHRLALELTQLGHRVTVVTNRYPRTLPASEIIDGIEVRRHFYPDVISSLLPLSPGRVVRRLLSFPCAPLSFARLLLLTARLRPDVVNVHYFSYPAAFMLAVARLLRLPVVLSLHGSDVPPRSPDGNHGSMLHWAAMCSGSITACSHDLAARAALHLRPRQQRRIIVAPNGVDVGTEYPDAPAADEARIIVISRLVGAKGVDVAIESVARLRGRGVLVQLDIAGDGPLRSQLELMAVALGIEKQIHFHGHVEPAGIRHLLSEARLCVVPSRSEGFGMSALEAMAAGRPVVASRVGGLPEIIRDGDTGLLVAPDDVVALVGAIESLLDRPDMARRMGTRGRERALRNFTWKRTTERYLEAYGLAGNPTSRSPRGRIPREAEALGAGRFAHHGTRLRGPRH